MSNARDQVCETGAELRGVGRVGYRRTHASFGSFIEIPYRGGSGRNCFDFGVSRGPCTSGSGFPFGTKDNFARVKTLSRILRVQLQLRPQLQYERGLWWRGLHALDLML
jgi:hypothetical protein